MKKILIFKFPYSSLFGGGEKHTLALVEELSKRDFRFYLVSSCQVLLEEFKKRNWYGLKFWAGVEPVAKASLFLFPLTAPFTFLSFWSILFYFRFFKGIRCLYCLSLTEKLLATLPARVFGMKVIWVEHVEVTRWLTLNPYRFLYVLMSNFVKIITVSEIIKNQLIEIGVKEKKIKVIYSGIDLSKYHQVKIYPFDPSRGKMTIGTVGRLEKEKGHEYLIRAFKAFLEIYPQSKLIIIGLGGQRQNLMWLAKKLEIDRRVHFLGFQKDVAKSINYFDIFVLPSAKRESFGLVLLEALACQKPVIASKIGGIPEIIEHKKDGLLIEPANTEEIVQALNYLCHHPEEAQAMAEQGRRKVLQQFTQERMVREFEQAFNF